MVLYTVSLTGACSAMFDNFFDRFRQPTTRHLLPSFCKLRKAKGARRMRRRERSQPDYGQNIPEVGIPHEVGSVCPFAIYQEISLSLRRGNFVTMLVDLSILWFEQNGETEMDYENKVKCRICFFLSLLSYSPPPSPSGLCIF